MALSDGKARRSRAAPPEAEGARIALSAEGRITSCTQAAERLLEVEAPAGRLLAEAFPGAGRALRRSLAERAQTGPFCLAPLGARSGRALALACWPLPTGDWEAFLLPLCGGSGREAQVLSELLHDLRTPLTTLMGAAELLQAGCSDQVPGRTAELLKALAGAATQIADMLGAAAARRDAPETERPA